MNQRIERLRHKTIARGIQLNPPLRLDDIVRFEQDYHITLPNGYRDFLLHLGNGGEGPPHYGLTPLPLSLDLTSIFDRVTLAQLQKMHLPFPFQEAWVWEDEELSSDDRQNDLIAEKHAALRCGHLVLGEDGCGQFWRLIVTGPERGNVWFYNDAGITPTKPKRDFLTWYENWLESATD